MKVATNNKRNITPEKAVEILAEHGTKVSIEEAKLILDFMYKFSILSVNQVVTTEEILNYEKTAK